MEVLLTPEEDRLSLFPIKYPHVWQRYKNALSSFWTVGEVDLSHDLQDWKKLNPGEQHFIKHVLAFFANSDAIVCDNLVDRFASEVKIREARCFYGVQVAIENIHNEMYALMIQTLIQDTAERQSCFNAIKEIECVKKKAKWAQRWIESEEDFATRLVAFALVEGIFFSGSFCAIFWLKKRQLLPGLCVSNTLIARDEGMHQEFATFLFKEMIKDKPPQERIHDMVNDAVAHEIEFVCDALPVSLIGMSSTEMSKYIKFVADRILVELGFEKLFFEHNPFDFMIFLGLENKTNFFEHRVTEYQKAGATASGHTFSQNDDF